MKLEHPDADKLVFGAIIMEIVFLLNVDKFASRFAGP
jgi:hypothetical protein